MRFPDCVTAVGLLVLMSIPASAQAQALGIGGRFSLIRADAKADVTGQRFTGGQIRAKMSPRTALEVALDMRSETNDALTERTREYPIQASLLLYPVRSVIAPYVLGGGGWYSHKVETLADKKVVASETSRDFGWHAGFGGELRLGQHAGAHADYRYTFLRFGEDEDTPAKAAAEGESGFGRFLPSYKGSMWTAGLTLYF